MFLVWPVRPTQATKLDMGRWKGERVKEDFLEEVMSELGVEKWELTGRAWLGRVFSRDSFNCQPF